MSCKFVLKCILRAKWFVDNNELIKAVAEIFSIIIYYLFLLFPYIYIYIYIYININYDIYKLF